MRIFYAADTSPNPEFSSNLWRKNLYESLASLGHELVEFRGDLRQTFLHLDEAKPEHHAFIETNRPQLSSEILRQVRAAHEHKPINLFFSYFYDACIEPAAIDEIRKLGITTVNWFCNASYQFHLVRKISPHYDWCLVPEKFRLADYIAAGANPLYCQEAANPEAYRNLVIQRDLNVTFVGQAYGERPAYIKYLLAEGIDVRVWGTRWEYFCAPPPSSNILRRLGGRAKRGLFRHKESRLPSKIHGGVLSDQGIVDVFNRSKINLGFSSCGETHRPSTEQSERIVQIRLRDFEVPMCGGFYLVEYMEELQEFYEIGKEIECYQSKEEMMEKIRFYLKHDAAREAIRVAGHARALKDHTWQKRFQDAFAAMKFQGC